MIDMKEKKHVYVENLWLIPVLRGNIQPWDGQKPAWGYACLEEPYFAQTVVAAIIYGFHQPWERTEPS